MQFAGDFIAMFFNWFWRIWIFFWSFGFYENFDKNGGIVVKKNEKMKKNGNLKRKIIKILKQYVMKKSNNRQTKK